MAARRAPPAREQASVALPGKASQPAIRRCVLWAWEWPLMRSCHAINGLDKSVSGLKVLYTPPGDS
jgi:hypothetical protein